VIGEVSRPAAGRLREVESVLSRLERFRLAGYVEEVRAVGRMALHAELRSTAAALFRRAREAAQVEGLPDETASTLRFAQAVLRPQWSMQLPGGKRYDTYINGPVLDWALALGHGGDDEGVLRRCADIVDGKGRSWHAYEQATLRGATSWNQVDVSPDHVQRRLRFLHKLIGLTEGLHWGAAGAAKDVSSPDRTWAEYASEPAGERAVEYLTTLPQTTQHDEVGFLTTIHIGECCFAAMTRCVGAAAAATRVGDAAAAVAHLDRAKPFADAFELSFAALATMPPGHFLGFVEATGQASAVQSRRYQQLEILLYGLHPAKHEAMGLFPELAELDPSGSVPLSRLLADRNGDPDFERVIASALSLDGSLYRWRARHHGASKRLYPFSGLELGSGYLASHFSRRLKSEIDKGGISHR
jgi:tryptophan 2,3-dioxygenase